MITPNTVLQALADQYCRNHHHGKPVRGHTMPVDHNLAHIIAAEYALLPRLDASAITYRCYQALFEQVADQFSFLCDAGYRIEQWTQADQPYHTVEELCQDIRDHYHLFVFTGGEPHPILSRYRVRMNGITWSGNDVLRTVHLLFGHACEGYCFDQQGEENAWIHQSMLLTALAQWALTTETRGVNAWYYQKPENANTSLHLQPFAVQKAALLPVTLSLLPIPILERWAY